MMYKTHLAFSFLLVMFTIPLFNPSNQILFLGIALISSMLPDIDHPESKLGRYFKPLSFLFEHRGFFHSVFPLMIFGFVLLTYTRRIYVIAFVVGYTSHLIGDLITRQGIMPFHPISKIRIRGFLRTGTFLEFLIFLIFIIINIILVIKMP